MKKLDTESNKNTGNKKQFMVFLAKPLFFLRYILLALIITFLLTELFTLNLENSILLFMTLVAVMVGSRLLRF